MNETRNINESKRQEIIRKIEIRIEERKKIIIKKLSSIDKKMYINEVITTSLDGSPFWTAMYEAYGDNLIDITVADMMDAYGYTQDDIKNRLIRESVIHFDHMRKVLIKGIAKVNDPLSIDEPDISFIRSL